MKRNRKMEKLKKGIFVLFEGGESCGKTVQQNLCFNHFSSRYKVVKMREPGSAPVSEGIRHLLLNPEMKMSRITELMLFEAARAQFVKDFLKPALEQHKLVLCDRSYYSTIAYQGFGRGIDFGTIELLNNTAMHGIKPDMAFIFDISYEESIRRMKKAGKVKDRIEKEDRDFHERVRQGYLYIAKNYPEAFLIESSLNVGTIYKHIIKKIEQYISRYS